MEETGDALTEDELLAKVGLLIVGGHETTSNLIGIGMLMCWTIAACDRQSVAVAGSPAGWVLRAVNCDSDVLQNLLQNRGHTGRNQEQRGARNRPFYSRLGPSGAPWNTLEHLLHRLQNGCSASFLVEGGFDSHAPPDQHARSDSKGLWATCDMLLDDNGELA